MFHRPALQRRKARTRGVSVVGVLLPGLMIFATKDYNLFRRIAGLGKSNVMIGVFGIPNQYIRKGALFDFESDGIRAIRRLLRMDRHPVVDRTVRCNDG